MSTKPLQTRSLHPINSSLTWVHHFPRRSIIASSNTPFRRCLHQRRTLVDEQSTKFIHSTQTPRTLRSKQIPQRQNNQLIPLEAHYSINGPISTRAPVRQRAYTLRDVSWRIRRLDTNENARLEGTHVGSSAFPTGSVCRPQPGADRVHLLNAYEIKKNNYKSFLSF